MPRKRSKTEQLMELLGNANEAELKTMYEVASYEMRRRELIGKRKKPTAKAGKVTTIPADQQLEKAN